jgi:hypothetical protein
MIKFLKLIYFKKVITGDQIGVIDIWDDDGNLTQIISLKNVKSFVLSLLLLPEEILRSGLLGGF